MVSSDEEWLPPPPPKEKPKNFAMLMGKKKKAKRSTRIRYECSYCVKRFPSKESQINHEKSVHGRMNILAIVQEIQGLLSETCLISLILSFQMPEYDPILVRYARNLLFVMTSCRLTWGNILKVMLNKSNFFILNQIVSHSMFIQFPFLVAWTQLFKLLCRYPRQSVSCSYSLVLPFVNCWHH